MNGTLANLDVKEWEAGRRSESQERDARLRDILGRDHCRHGAYLQSGIVDKQHRRF